MIEIDGGFSSSYLTEKWMKFRLKGEIYFSYIYVFHNLFIDMHLSQLTPPSIVLELWWRISDFAELF